MSEEEIQRYNTRTMWDEVSDRLGVAAHELDLVAANLAPIAESIQRFKDLADGYRA